MHSTVSPQPGYDIRQEGQIYEPQIAAERRFAAEVATGRHVVRPTVEHLQEALDVLSALIEGTTGQGAARRASHDTARSTGGT